MAERLGPDLGKNLQEIPVNIVIANKFGTLGEEDMVAAEKETPTVIEANTSKENMGHQSRKGKSGAQGINKEARFSSGENIDVGKGGFQAQRGEGNKQNKPISNNGPKIKQAKPIRPGRGLVFGPARGEVSLSESGKRLRVENSDLDRQKGNNGRGSELNDTGTGV